MKFNFTIYNANGTIERVLPCSLQDLQVLVAWAIAHAERFSVSKV